jgi:alkylation response protein AidB-like acyl-CoA dehydrogenase
MDVALTDEQQQLRISAREFLEAECPMHFVRLGVDPPERAPTSTDPAASWQPLWSKMAALGWHGLAIPEAYGGAGLGFVELAVLLEETGRALLPAPFFSSAVLGAQTLLIGADASSRDELLPAVARGQLRLTLAQRDEDGDWSANTSSVKAQPSDDGYVLSGRKTFVVDADTADAILVVAATESGPTLFLAHRGLPGLDIRRVDYVDRTRPVCDVTFRDVELGHRARIGAAGTATDALERVNDLARLALAAEACGGAQWALDASVAYAGSREQFGAPIGSFQAIGHKCADMFVKVESARSAAYYAAWSATEREPDAHVSACMAKAYCADAFAEVAGEAIQVHGGLGFTWEHDIHLYYKRAKATQLAFGDSTFTREVAARVLIDGETPQHA